MGIKNCLLIFAVFMISFLPIYSSVIANNDITVEIHMIGELARTRFDNPVTVTGVWHYINVTTDDQFFQELILKFYKGNSILSIGDRNESNYYEWRYNTNSQEWIDINKYGGYSYINDTNCQKTGNTYSFCIGVKDTFPEITNYYENWTLEIYEDVNQRYSENVVLEKPMVGLARSHADVIKFNVNPFTIRSIEGNDYFIIENVGNIPLSITIDYGTFNDYIEVTNFGNTLSPYTSSNLDITLQSGSWKPGILKITGNVRGFIPSSLIITTSVITFQTSIEINAAELEISIGHSNYIIQEIPGSHIVFQYEKNLEMNEGQIRDTIVYISGDGEVKLDIWSDEKNITILEISSKDQTGTPLTITSTNTSEYAVTIRVEALRENKVGVINYKLEENEKIQTFSTQITIGQPLQEKTEDTNMSITSIIVALCIIFVIGYIISAQIRKKRR
ncbi:MAG: hypothetical protein JSW06_11335 [Thermoplasmatales archaeon]|nr:MAG: hypothetical protein JSW06_11335 [Thermoplasmatales archaeon]